MCGDGYWYRDESVPLLELSPFPPNPYGHRPRKQKQNGSKYLRTVHRRRRNALAKAQRVHMRAVAKAKADGSTPPKWRGVP